MDNQQDNHIRLLSPLILAYMRDVVLDQYIRTYITLELKSRPSRLHQMSKRYVSARSQVQTLEYLMEQGWFTDEGIDALKQGHNAKNHTKAKNIDIQTYRKSPTIEAAIDFLYLEKREERLEALLNKITTIANER